MSLVATATLDAFLGSSPANGQALLDAAEALLASMMGLETLEEQVSQDQILEPARVSRMLPVYEGPLVVVNAISAAPGSYLEGDPLLAADLVVSPWSVRLKDAASVPFYAHQRLVLNYDTGWATEGDLPQSLLSAILSLASFMAAGRDQGVTGERLGDYSYSLAADPTRSDPEKSLPMTVRMGIQRWRAPTI